MKRTIIGIDLAKNVFEVYVEDGSGAVVERKQLSRKKLLPWLANRPPALVGMEACGGAHYWARELTKLGHEVRLIAPPYVKPWVQTNKSDAADPGPFAGRCKNRGCGSSAWPAKRSRPCKPSIEFGADTWAIGRPW